MARMHDYSNICELYFIFILCLYFVCSVLNFSIHMFSFAQIEQFVQFRFIQYILLQGCHTSGKNKIFSRSGNFGKCQGMFAI